MFSFAFSRPTPINHKLAAALKKKKKKRTKIQEAFPFGPVLQRLVSLSAAFQSAIELEVMKF